MRPTRISLLVAVFVVFAAVTIVVLRDVYSGLPPLPWSAVPTFGLLALGEAYMGLNFRARIARKPGTRPVEALAVMRLAALAKATAYAGVAFAGVFGGFLLFALGLIDKSTPQHDALAAGVTLAAALVLLGAALFCEYCCRVPRRPDDDDEDDDDGPAPDSSFHHP